MTYKDSPRWPSVQIKCQQNRHVDIMDPATPLRQCQAYGKNVQTVTKSATSEGYVGSGEPES